MKTNRETIEENQDKIKEVAKRNGQDEALALSIATKISDMGGSVIDVYQTLNTADRLGITPEQAYDDWQKTVGTPGFQCPRRGEGGPTSYTGVDHWDSREGDCSYCGSMHPDSFMELLRSGAQITPTDKNYKAYVSVPTENPGEPCRIGSECGPSVTRDGRWSRDDLTDEEKAAGRYDRPIMGKVPEAREHKFYYQHLSEDQCREFIQLYNDKKMNIGYPGYFYSMPFFCTGVGNVEETE